MMKKILIIGTIASSMAFAKGFNNNNSMTTGQGMGGTQGKNYSQVANLTEAQQKDLADIKAKHQKSIAPLMLDKQEKELAIKKELLADKPNWTKIESLVKEKEAIESKTELQMLKNRAEIKEKFGLNFGNDFGKGHGMGQGKGFKK